MTSARANLKINPAIGSLPVLQYCSPDQLCIDESYQRALETAGSRALIRKIAVDWDWGLCQPLFVARRADGLLYVVDGQHRLAAANMRGDIWQLPCVVSSFVNAAAEAASFVALNQQRRPLSKYELFRAALAAGDTEAAFVAEAVEGAGLRLTGNNSVVNAAPGALNNIAGLQICYRRHGAAVLAISLDVMAQAYKGQKLRFAGTLFPGIAEIVADELKLDPGFDDGELFELMTEMVGGAEQSEWWREISIALAESRARDRRASAGLIFRTAWAECREAALDEAA